MLVEHHFLSLRCLNVQQARTKIKRGRCFQKSNIWTGQSRTIQTTAGHANATCPFFQATKLTVIAVSIYSLWLLLLATETINIFKLFLAPKALLRCRVAKMRDCRVPRAVVTTAYRIIFRKFTTLFSTSERALNNLLCKMTALHSATCQNVQHI